MKNKQINMKKNIISKLIFGSLLVVTVLNGCKKSEFDINTEPDNITSNTVDYQAVLPATMTSHATAVGGSSWRFLQMWLGYWARSGSYQDNTQEESYVFSNDLGVAIWNNWYTTATNYDFVMLKAKERNAGTYESIARILRANSFQMLVDIYGNIPYSEALQTTAFPTPKYDNGVDIYKALLAELDTAIVRLNDPVSSSADNNTNIATNDLVYQGNTTNWIKYANTLKLRMLMHLGNTTFNGSSAPTNTWAPGIDVPAEMAKITATGAGFLTATAKINPGYTDAKPSPFYRAYVKDENGSATSNGDYSRANVYAVGPVGSIQGYYGYNGDPRINRFYVRPAGATAHRGIAYGELAGVNSNNIGSRLSLIWGPGIVPNGAASDAWFFTAEESYFLQAEAAARGVLSGNAQNLLIQGIRASFVHLGLTAADADTYIANNEGYADVDYTAPSLGPGLEPGGIYTILSQKWFALNVFAPWEVWTDWRRTGIVYGHASEYLDGPPISVNPANTKTTLPVRLFYPQREFNYNAENVRTQGTIDVFTSKIFWDLN